MFIKNEVDSIVIEYCGESMQWNNFNKNEDCEEFNKKIEKHIEEMTNKGLGKNPLTMQIKAWHQQLKKQ